MYGIGFIHAPIIAVMAAMDSIVAVPPCLCILESTENPSIKCGINGPDNRQLSVLRKWAGCADEIGGEAIPALERIR